MAMLAEPRRKQKVINLRAKNNAWSNDSNKFGQRMLEKMGWSSGKGLGANENGIVEHVVARYKNDEKGLGFEDRNDQWTKHDDDFNALLANLSNTDDKEQQSHSGISLEVKSKKSKARVHFHKFTRAKDLSRYSEKELANIFGKKSLKSKEKQEEVLKDDLKTTEQVFTEKGSMADYFKNKLLTLGSKNKAPLPVYESSYDVDADCAFRGFSGTTNDENGHENASHDFEFKSFKNNANADVESHKPDEQNEVNNVVVSDETVECVRKSKKKKSKNIDNTENIESLNNENEVSGKMYSNRESNNCTSHEVLEKKLSKKSKKSKHKRILENVCVTEEVEEDLPKKKKKKKQQEEQVVIKDENQNDDTDDHVPKKKKKKKNKEIIN